MRQDNTDGALVSPYSGDKFPTSGFEEEKALSVSLPIRNPFLMRRRWPRRLYYSGFALSLYFSFSLFLFLSLSLFLFLFLSLCYVCSIGCEKLRDLRPTDTCLTETRLHTSGARRARSSAGEKGDGRGQEAGTRDQGVQVSGIPDRAFGLTVALETRKPCLRRNRSMNWGRILKAIFSCGEAEQL